MDIHCWNKECEHQTGEFYCKAPGNAMGCEDHIRLTPTTKKEPVADTSCNMGLVALQKLSEQFRGEAEQRLAPPQDEFDIPKHEVVETLLYCADEIDRAIKEIRKTTDLT